jgi:hypothetical protein
MTTTFPGAGYYSGATNTPTAGHIKSGVSIAGVTGQYPSASFPLAGADNTADLDTATFDAKIKSSTAFEYWTSAGDRQIGSGDTDISDFNIKNNIDIFGTTGSMSAGTTPDAWDLRAGVTVGNVTGKLRANCRNRANLSFFDIDLGQAATVTVGSPGIINIVNHGFTNGMTVRLNYSSAPTNLHNATTYYVINATTNNFQLSETSGGAAINIFSSAGANVVVHRWQATPKSIDISDTIDDSNSGVSGVPPDLVSAWGVGTDCGGVEVTAGDDNVWQDVTTSTGGLASSCVTDSARCTMRDKITGLWWSKWQASSSWIVGWSSCLSLNYNGQTGWRLPTQKELMEAYNHGIRSAAGANWIPLSNMTSSFWSATTSVQITNNAWQVTLANGTTSLGSTKTSAANYVCVR